MRANPWFLAIAIAGCRPSATVENTLPVANLQSYGTVALRVQSTAFAAQGHAASLETAVLQRLHQSCGFSDVGRPGAKAADVVLDLNITGMARGGGGGIISNPNLATLDTLLVLTDGSSGELLGTARIRGKSSGMIINSAPPENEAIDVVARTIANLLAKSGCSGPRIAKVEPPPAPVDPGPSAPDEGQRAKAEAFNEQGKEKLRSADMPGALAAFQQANTILPDARYEFNVCLTYEAQEQWGNAITACQQARSMSPQPTLSAKIDRRIDLLTHRK